MKFKIVLAEDNRMERKNMEYIVNSIPECAITAVFSNGRDALDYLRENEADILIADIQMPDLNGVDLIRRIVDENIDIEKIVISAYSEFDYAQKLIGLDVSGYVMKPFVDSEFEDTIKKTMNTLLKKKEKIHRINVMTENYEKMRPVLVDNFFRNLILIPGSNKEYIEKNEKSLNLELTGKYKTIMTVSVLDKNPAPDFYMYTALMNIISENSNEDIKCYPLMLNENDITVVAIYNKGNNITAFAVKLKNTIVEQCGINVFVGLSNESGDTERLNILYNQSKSIIKNYSGNYKNVVITYASIDECGNEHDLFMDILKHELQNIVNKSDNNGCKKLLKKYLDAENSKIWKHNFTVCYINILEIILNEVGESFDTLVGNEKVWISVAKFDSIVDLEQWLYNLTDAVIFHLHNSGFNEKMIAGKIIKVIKENYNQKISVKYIADKLNFSREYLHRVFVHVTGKSVLEYLTEYRIEKAKEILENGGKTSDVAEMVGYSDKSYFSDVFKSHTGVTPAEYKREHTQR